MGKRDFPWNGGTHAFRTRQGPVPVWWNGDEPLSLDPSVLSDRLDLSIQSSFAGGPFSETSVCTPLPDDLLIVPVQGSETPITRAKLPGIHGSSTPEVRKKLANADPENVHEIAMRLYSTLKQHGLSGQAERAFRHLNEANNFKGEDKQKVEEELVGMQYILKDGIVGYLRDVARIIPPIPRQVVRFIGINYTAKVPVSQHGYETFGKKFLNCFLGPFMNIGRKKVEVELEILKDMTGYVMPGSLTLLLGPPGSGKSTFLKVLAGRAFVNRKTVLEGTVLYNGNEASEVLLTRIIAYINGQLNKHIPYLTVRETLEFAENCTQGLRPENFSPQMRKFFAHALVEGQDPFLEYVLEVLGLKSVEHQLVGSGQEGITENDRARLTTAEIALGTYSVLLYDQPCAAQDSLATYDLVSTLRAISRIQQCSAVMALVQLSDEAFDLFDRIILLGEGQILYQGPRQDVLYYFAELGYIKPAYVDAGGFLQDIAAGEGAQYMDVDRLNLTTEELVLAYKNSEVFEDIVRVVNSADVLNTFWVESEPSLGLTIRTPTKQAYAFYDQDESMQQGLEVVVAKLSKKVDYTRGIESTGCIQVGDIVTGISTNDGEMRYVAVGSVEEQQSRAESIYTMLKNARGHVRLQVQRLLEEDEKEEYRSPEETQFSKPFVQDRWASAQTLIKRQLKVAKRLQILIQLRLIQVFVLGLFGGCLFWRAGGKYKPTELNMVRALGFVSSMSILLVNMVQLPVYMMQRPIFYKQRAQRFFRASSYVIAHSTINIPQSFIEALVYTLCVYFLTSLSLEQYGAHLLEFLMLLFLVCYMGSSLVLLLSAVAPILEAANALAGLIVSIFLLFSGFVIYPYNIPVYWRWLYYANPLHWANLVFCTTQIGQTYSDPCSEHRVDLDFCAIYPDLTVGVAFLKRFQLLEEYEPKWLWISYAVLLGWIVVINVLCVLALNKLNFPEVNHSLPRPKVSTSLTNPVEIETEDGRGSWSSSPTRDSVDRRTPRWEDQIEKGSNERDEDEELANRENCWQSSNLPVKHVTLAFYNLVFSTMRKEGKERTILNRVSGYAKPGNMLALIGSSKSGKTTLLKVLAGRLPEGNLQGEILCNGNKTNKYAYSRVVGFVERLDAHQPFLTVRESLHFSAALRLSNNVTVMERVVHVELILDLLGLVGVRNQLVGSIRDTAGRTYEIAKKITIAVELAANPSILFLDEPTTGLDSVGSRNVLLALQTIATTGRTIVSTVQHPSAQDLSTFGNILILSTGGEQVYFGPVGFNCHDLVVYFSSIPKAPQYSDSQNPFTYVLDVLGAGIKPRNPLQNLESSYRSSSLASLNADELHRLRRQNHRRALKPVASQYAAPLRVQAAMVFLRTQRFLWRNTSYTFGRLTGSIALGLLMGSIYFRIGYTDTFGLTSRSLYIYMQVMLIGVITSNNVVPQVGSDRLAYYRERRANMYAPIFYPISWVVAEIPYLLLASLAFAGIGNAFAAIATDSFYHFILYWLSLFIFTLSVTYFGMLLTLATPQPVLAAFVVSIITSMWVTGSGVVVPFQKIHHLFKWIFWANPYQYVINTLTYVSFYCDTSLPACLACVPMKPCPACPCQRLTNLNDSFSWDRLDSVRDIRETSTDFDYLALLGMAVVFSGLAFLAFAFMKHNANPGNK